MLNKLKELNKDIPFFHVNSEEFKPFGRVIDIDATEIIEVGEKIEKPAGSSYTPSLAEFEALEIAKTIKREFFGTLPSQIGYCWGHNNMMNATEWHTSSEVNIAVTDVVLILGHLWEVEDGKIDSSRFKAFYLPKGTVAEVYATSLHYCPCEVEKEGFGCVVCLPKDTNTALEENCDDKLLRAKNKALIEKGAVAGLTGTNYKINY